MNIVQFAKRNKLLAAVALTYAVLFITMPDKAVLSIKNSMYYVIEMLEIIPVIFLLTAIIEAWAPRELIINSFGEKSGWKGNVFSLILGSFSAGPIYAAFPVCKMLLRKGASMINIVIILSAWAVVKVPMLANEAKFLGVEFMGVRWILTVISIWMTAYIMSAIVKKENIPIYREVEIEKINAIDIKEQYCMGCGLCAKFSPDHFEIMDKKAKVKKKKIEEEKVAGLRLTIEKCPAKAICFK